MIRANELTVGDWALYMGKPHYVIAIETDGIVKITTPELADLCRRATWTDRMEPIPLTPEILEKNGFGYRENDTLFELHHFYLGEPRFCKNMNLHIGNKKDVFWIDYNSNHIGGIRYVHELQHALRLCGIEKEITM